MRPGQPHEQTDSVSAVVCRIPTIQQPPCPPHIHNHRTPRAVQIMFSINPAVCTFGPIQNPRKPLHIPLRSEKTCTRCLLFSLSSSSSSFSFSFSAAPAPRPSSTSKAYASITDFSRSHRGFLSTPRFLFSPSFLPPRRRTTPSPSSPLLLSCCCELCGQRRRPHLWRVYIWASDGIPGSNMGP